MPYITQHERVDLVGDEPDNPKNCGQLNFVITNLIHNYIENKGLCYYTINEVIGVLSCSQMELYRTVASPYEDKKRSENGSVSDLDSINLEDVR